MSRKKANNCRAGSWNGVTLTDGYRDAGWRVYQDKDVRRDRSAKRHRGLANVGGDAAVGNIKITEKIPKVGGISYYWKDKLNYRKAVTEVHFGGRHKKTFNGFFYIIKGQLKMVKYIPLGKQGRGTKRNGLARSRYVRLARFKWNPANKYAIVMVSPGERNKEPLLLFIKSNGKKAYDIINGKWIDHPYPKCNSNQEDILKEYCDAKTDKETQCPQAYINFNPFGTMGKPCDGGRIAVGFDAHGRTICRNPGNVSQGVKNMYIRSRWRNM
tara:strand:- start:77 stop:886 length:810 start_codon:yes stop_codon:yes gene_type:complete